MQFAFAPQFPVFRVHCGGILFHCGGNCPPPLFTLKNGLAYDVGPVIPYLIRVHIGDTWRIRLNDQCAATLGYIYQLLLAAVDRM